MKLEVGQFVRTKKGTIFKIVGGNVDMWEIDIEYSYLSKCENEDYDSYAYNKNNSLFEELVVKASYNIIDILEVGDYVNGCYVSNKRASVNEHLGGHSKEIGIIKCNAYFNQGNYNDCKFEWIEEKDIKSIVTKEQFESMKYRIGDE